MEINFLDSQTTLGSRLSKKDLKYFEKNPFGNVATKANNKGLKIILSLGREKSSSINKSIIFLKMPRENLILLSKSETILFRLSRNPFGVSSVSISLDMS